MEGKIEGRHRTILRRNCHIGCWESKSNLLTDISIGRLITHIIPATSWSHSSTSRELHRIAGQVSNPVQR